MRDMLRNPAVVVFLLGTLGAIIGWGVRQEIINRTQQQAIDQQIPPAELQRRLGYLEGRVDTLEKARNLH